MCTAFFYLQDFNRVQRKATITLHQKLAMSKKLKEPEDSFLKQKKLNDEVLKALSLVLESMAEGVNVSNDKGIILFTNPAFDDVFG